MTTITLKPSQEIVAQVNAETTITDSAGRIIKIKKPGVLTQYRLIEALGDSAQNQTYMGMVLPLIYVVSIDGLAVNPPKTKMQVEALIQQLDEAGIEAVMKCVQETFGKNDPEKDAADLKK